MVKPSDPPSDDVLLRSLLLLETLAGMEQPASLEAIMARTGLPKSKAYRTLRALQDVGFADRVGKFGYRVGARALALSLLIGPRPGFLRIARPILRWLADVTHESATLFLRGGTHRILVLGARPPDQSLAYELPPIGERAPLETGASGLAILAHLPRGEIAEVLATRTGRKPTLARLDEIRHDGYATSFSGNRRGANGVSAPILDPADRYPLGSIAVAGAAERVPEQTLQAHAKPLRRACAQLAPQLATMLGPHASQRQATLDVAIAELTDTNPAGD